MAMVTASDGCAFVVGGLKPEDYLTVHEPGEAASGGGPIVAASVGDNFEKEASLQDHFVSRQRPQANRVLSTSVSRLA